jgi:hypothetical protein
LFAAGDALAAQGKYDEALLKYKEAYDQLVPLIRGLPFKQPVQPRLMARPELREYMLKEFETDYTPAEWELMDGTLKVFGFIPPTLSFRETMLNLLTEEVGGFYNPRSKELFLIKEEPRKRNIVARLLSGPEFDAANQRIVLSHEMTHALADQHFDLLGIDDFAKNNDDMLLAVSALVEGEATLVMMSELLGDEVAMDRLTRLDPSRIDFIFKFMNFLTPFVGGRTARTAPPIFYDSLVFPYHKGCVFVLHLSNRGGWDAINDAFREPPVSTEQILHWEKYRRERDDPTAIELPALGELLGDQWHELGSNTLGELQVTILLDRTPGGPHAAAGWDGDRFQVYRGPAEQLALAWFTTWDSDDDAREFAAACSRYLVSKRLAGNEQEARAAAVSWSAEPRQTWRREHQGYLAHIELRGSDVVVIAGFPPEETERVLPAMWESQKAPLTIRRAP